jgi:hypothetical protein
MSKRNAALEALTRTKPASEPNIVEFKTEQPVVPVSMEDPAEPAAPAIPLAKMPERKTVANSAARSMLYLPPKAKRKFKEIAFHEDRKEHDIYIEALREYLERKGHKGLL